MSLKRLYIAGHRGLVGQALLRHYADLSGWQLITRTRQELDLTDAAAVQDFFAAEKPDYVIMAAAKVGGIKAAYSQAVEFLLENMKIQNSILQAAYEHQVTKLLFLGSTCVYPKNAEIPIKESSLLSGPMEVTNEAYSIGKIAGIRLCQAFRQQYGRDFIVAMPANLYGPYDNFDPEHSHALPSMMRKFHEAKVKNLPAVTLWGTGNPKREFLYVDDLARACAFLLDTYSSPEIVNVGVGNDISIREAAEKIRETIGYEGDIVWDSTQPDGNPRRILDLSKIHSLGWKAQMPFVEGLETTYRWFLKNRA
ncbi:MAG: GDP-L-fucose synthase [Blastochloris sp.]|nr:GDP-L-fucose synthase [Blastochloris sp.]